MAEDTLVLFASDNGCAPYIGVHEMEAQGHYPSAGFRGYKSDAWDGGHRIPCLARWPGVIPPGSRCDLLLRDGEGGAVWVEIKNVTWVRRGVACFPDAPTARGRKHLADLARCVAAGQRAALVLCAQRADAERDLERWSDVAGIVEPAISDWPDEEPSKGAMTAPMETKMAITFRVPAVTPMVAT